jgi:hypothetical protein
VAPSNRMRLSVKKAAHDCPRLTPRAGNLGKWASLSWIFPRENHASRSRSGRHDCETAFDVDGETQPSFLVSCTSVHADCGLASPFIPLLSLIFKGQTQKKCGESAGTDSSVSQSLPVTSIPADQRLRSGRLERSSRAGWRSSSLAVVEKRGPEAPA